LKFAKLLADLYNHFMRKRYISTPIYYANGAPHVGHLYTTLIADVMKRAGALMGEEIFFLSGMDEHGQKVAQAALAQGYSAKEHVDFISEEFWNFFNSFNIFPDCWIRTTDKDHEKAAQAFWQKVQENGYIYKSKYAGWYHLSDENYLNEAAAEEFADGKNPNVVWREEDCYFFKLSAFKDRLMEFLAANPGFIYPKKRYNEVMGWFAKDLKDFAVSRPKERLSWGVEVPGDPSHVMYVWIDALVNYLSAIGYPDEKYKELWPGTHLLGKEIVKFHAIYWPALLMAAGVELPKQLFVHGWLLMGDDKISKSLGNAVSLDEIVAKYQVDGLRYYLLKGLEFGEDGQFREDLVKQVVNGDLANKFGNIFLRLLGIVELAFENRLPEAPEFSDSEMLEKLQKVYNFVKEIPEHPQKINEYLNSFMDCVLAVNSYFEENRVWTIEDRAQKAGILYFLLDFLKKLTILVSPVMPNVAEKIMGFFQLQNSMESYNTPLNRVFNTSRPVLFPKI